MLFPEENYFENRRITVTFHMIVNKINIKTHNIIVFNNINVSMNMIVTPETEFKGPRCFYFLQRNQ